MRVRALLIACLAAGSSLIALPANAASAIQFRKMIKRSIAGAAGLALTLGGAALATAPAEALTGAPCDDGGAWSWSITNPARYQAGPHEAVVGLSEAIRTVTIKAPTGCTVEAGDTWRIYNGYFSALQAPLTLRKRQTVKTPTVSRLRCRPPTPWLAMRFRSS